MSVTSRRMRRGLQATSAAFILVLYSSMGAFGQGSESANDGSTTSPPAAIELTDEERDWLKRHPSIEFGVDGNWPPIDFVDDEGRHSGITAEYLKLISARLGVEFTVAPGPTFKQMLARLMRGELKAGATVTPREERAKKLYFTKPFYRVPKVIVIRDDASDVGDLKALYGKKVAVEDGFAVMRQLQEGHPEIILEPVKDTREALKLVSFGRADAYVGNLPVARWLMLDMQLSNLVFVADAGLGSGPQAFAVFKDPEWEPLAVILDKALASISAEERRRIRSKFIGSIVTTRPAVSEARGDNSLLLVQIGGGTLAVVAVLLIVALLVKSLDERSTSQVYESRQIKGIGALLVGAFLSIVVLATWFTVESSEEKMRREVGASLQSVLNTTHGSLQVWVEGRKGDLTAISETPPLRVFTENLLSVPRAKDDLLPSLHLLAMRNYLFNQIENFGMAEFLVIAPDRVTIGSTNDEEIGTVSIIERQRKDALDRVFAGDVVVVPPVVAGTGKARGSPTMFFAGPIWGSTGDVIAAIALKVDPFKNFTRIVRLGRIGEAGETLALDRTARLITESRFDADLRRAGVLAETENGILTIAFRDPGGDLLGGHAKPSDLDRQPLTVMAADVTAGRQGRNFNGYRDYRGVTVMGAWLWDAELGFGLATEIEEAEALKTFFSVRDTVLFVLGIAVVMALVLTGLSIWIGQSANRSLRHAKDHLEIEVANRTAELNDRVVELRDREERLEEQAVKLMAMAEDLTLTKDGLAKLNVQKDKFFSIIAHDLKGPFTSLLGLSGLLASQVDRFDKDTVAKSANTVNESAQRVFKLLENLLEWARLQMDSLDYEPAPVDLADVIGANLDLFDQPAADKRIRLDASRTEPVMAFADAEMANTVIRNLIGNAIKFTPEDGTISVGTGRNDGMAEVTVTDTGVGMPPAQLESIFKLDEKTTTVGTGGERGTGLGLILCKELAEKQGGDIAIESSEGEGSTFRFTLPLSRA